MIRKGEAKQNCSPHHCKKKLRKKPSDHFKELNFNLSKITSRERVTYPTPITMTTKNYGVLKVAAMQQEISGIIAGILEDASNADC